MSDSKETKKGPFVPLAANTKGKTPLPGGPVGSTPKPPTPANKNTNKAVKKKPNISPALVKCRKETEDLKSKIVVLESAEMKKAAEHNDLLKVKVALEKDVQRLDAEGRYTKGLYDKLELKFKKLKDATINTLNANKSTNSMLTTTIEEILKS